MPPSTPEVHTHAPSSPLARLGRSLALLVGGTAIGWLAHHPSSPPAPSTQVAAASFSHGIPLKDGPWGELYATPFTLSAPEELLPVRRFEEEGIRWVFPQMTREKMATFLDSIHMPADLRESMLAPSRFTELINSCEMRPSADDFFAIPAAVRLPLYRQVAGVRENSSQISFMHRNTIGDRLGNSGLSESSLALVRQVCCEHGDYLVFAGLPAVLSRLPSYEEKLALVRGLTRQRTMTVSIKMHPGMNVDAIADYWGKGIWTTDVKTILSSVASSPGGGTLDILSLLPPLPSSRPFFYPTPDNPMKGSPPNRDCHWTALNFFNEEPDPKFGIPSEVIKEVRDAYYPINGDPRYGDVVMLGKPNGDIIHSAVFLADDIVFTKNGATPIHPWMLSTLPDLLRQYSFNVEPNEKLTVNYFRKKSA